jgi:hypothetical protein
MTCLSCQRDLLDCDCPGVDEQIRLRLREPEGKALAPTYYNALVRKAAAIISRRMGEPIDQPMQKTGLRFKNSLHSLRPMG